MEDDAGGDRARGAQRRSRPRWSSRARARSRRPALADGTLDLRMRTHAIVEGDRGRAGAGDARRPARVRARRGRGRGRPVRHDRRDWPRSSASERVLNTPISRERDLRRGDRRRPVGHAADRRGDVHRLRARWRSTSSSTRRPRRTRMSGRAAVGAARAAHAGRRGAPLGRAALAEPRELADPRPGPEGRDAEPRGRRARACWPARSPTRTRSCSSRTRRSTSRARTCRRAAAGADRARAAWSRPGTDVTIVALFRLHGLPVAGRGRGVGRPRASRWR